MKLKSSALEYVLFRFLDELKLSGGTRHGRPNLYLSIALVLVLGRKALLF